jgi:hypothetical protein
MERGKHGNVTLGMYMREDFHDEAIFISKETGIGRNISHSSRTSRRVNGHRMVLWLALCNAHDHEHFRKSAVFC